MRKDEVIRFIMWMKKRNESDGDCMRLTFFNEWSAKIVSPLCTWLYINITLANGIN